MNKWIMRALYALPILLIGGYALSDYTATQGTVAAFVCQSTKICPGVAVYDVTGTTGVAVKAASTAAAATDPSAVVQDAYLALDFGAPGATACATDTASCNLNQQMQRLAQRLSTLVTALGTPFQASGVIGALPTGTNKIGTVDPATAASWGLGATGSAPPSSASYLGANASGATGGHMAGLISCDNHVFKHITSATDTLAVQGVASQTIYICGWRSRAAGTATWFLENTASANANCSSSNTQINGLAPEVANSGETMLTPFWTGLKNTSGNGLCINSTGTGGEDIDIWYAQF